MAASWDFSCERGRDRGEGGGRVGRISFVGTLYWHAGKTRLSASYVSIRRVESRLYPGNRKDLKKPTDTLHNPVVRESDNRR